MHFLSYLFKKKQSFLHNLEKKLCFFLNPFFSHNLPSKVYCRGDLFVERNFNCIYKRKDGRYETRFVKKVKEGGKKIYGYVQGNSYRDVKIKKN